MDRRSFLGTVTAATLLSRKLGWAAEGHKIDRIGVQLYTVRAQMKQDFEGTLAKVAEIGYREVEFAGYFDSTPKEIKAILARHGLTAPASHIDYASLTNNWPKTLENANIIGQSYIVCPMIPDELLKQPDGWHKAAQTFNQAAEASKKAGLQFAYHNHHFEFVLTNGKVPYDILLAETDRNLVKMELDLCWAIVGGADPVAYFDNYPGRFPLVHVKDMKMIPTPTGSEPYVPFERLHPQMTEVGSGMIDWKRIFEAADKGGIKHYFVEHDEPKSPFESIKNSFTYLQNLRF
jgi:sugar phosphate isomerase/epimerase